MSDERSNAHAPAEKRPAFIDARRRGLLQGATVVMAAGAAGAGTMAGAAEPAGAAPSVEARVDAGYRLTDHVRRYYAKARS